MEGYGNLIFSTFLSNFRLLQNVTMSTAQPMSFFVLRGSQELGQFSEAAYKFLEAYGQSAFDTTDLTCIKQYSHSIAPVNIECSIKAVGCTPSHRQMRFYKEPVYLGFRAM